MVRIGIISNPYARINKHDPDLHLRLSRLLGERGLFRTTRSIADLAVVCREFREAGIRHLGVVGGDGSIAQALSAVREIWKADDFPTVLALGGGTMNVLAHNLGLRHGPLVTLKSVLRDLDVNTRLPSVQIVTLQAGGVLGFQFAASSAVRFLETFYANKGSPRDAARLVASVAWNGLLNRENNPALSGIIHRDSFTLEMHGPDGAVSSVEGPHSVVFMSTIPKIAFGFKVFPHAPLGCTHAEVVFAQSVGRAFLRDAVCLGLGGGTHQRRCVQRMVVRTDTPFRWTMDGELFTTDKGPLTVEIGPRFMFYSTH